MSSWQSIIMALGSAITGGGFLKFLEWFLNRSKFKSEQDKQFRDELRNESADLRKQIEALKEELKTAEKELDEFKEKYWAIYMQYQQFRLQVYAILVQHNIPPDSVLPAGMTMKEE